MKALLDRESLINLPSVAQWLQYAESTRRIMTEKYTHLSGAPLVTATVQENVLMQLENLRTHPSVAAALARGALRASPTRLRCPTGPGFELYILRDCRSIPVSR